MSLEELRAQVEAEENQPEQEAEAIELEETAEESEGEEQAQEEPEADDFELELAGEPEPQQQKPSAEEALIHKLTKERKKAKVVKDENDSLRQEIAELKALVKGVQQPASVPVSHAGQPKFPDLYDAGIDGDRSKYNDAVAKYLADLNQYNNRHSEADNAQAKHKQRVEDLTKNLAIRAAKFATDNKVNVDRVASALERATDEIDSHVSVPGAMAYLLDSVGDGGERVAYFIGDEKNPQGALAMKKIKQLLSDDPNGLKAAAYITGLARDLKPKQSKQISKAPEPDQPVKGDSVGSASAKKLQDLWDKATKPDEMMKIRRRARELGVELKT